MTYINTHTHARAPINYSSRFFLIYVCVCFCHVIQLIYAFCSLLTYAIGILIAEVQINWITTTKESRMNVRARESEHIDHRAFVIRIMLTMRKLLKNLCLYLIAHSIAIAKPFFFWFVVIFSSIYLASFCPFVGYMQFRRKKWIELAVDFIGESSGIFLYVSTMPSWKNGRQKSW